MIPHNVQSIDIPPRPALLMALQHEMRKEDPFVKKIAQLIGRDVAIAGALLDMANSAAFNLSQKTVSLESTITLFGLDQFNAIVTSLIMRRTLFASGMMMNRFWDVSEKRATGLVHMAKKTRAAPVEAAQTFGLFCDIGIPVLKARVPKYLETLALANRTAAKKFLLTEDTHHKVNHTEIGVLLAERWGISSDVVFAIRMHHTHEVLHDDSFSAIGRGLIAMNYLVEKAIEEHRGQNESLEWIHAGDAAKSFLGLTTDDVDDMCYELRRLFGPPRITTKHYPPAAGA